MITFIARIRVKPECADAYEALMKRVVESTHANETRVPYYEYAKSVDEPNTYVVVEVYADVAAQAAHMASPWVTESLPSAMQMMDGSPDIRQYVTPGAEPVRFRRLSNAEPGESI